MSILNRLARSSRPAAKWSRKALSRLPDFELPSASSLSHAAADLTAPALSGARKAWKAGAELTDRTAHLTAPTVSNARRALAQGAESASATLSAYANSTARWVRPAARRARHTLDVGAAAALPILTDGASAAAQWAAPVARRTGAAVARGAALALPVLAGVSHAAMDRAGPALDRTRRALRRPSLPLLLGVGAAVVGVAVVANLVATRRAERRHPARGKFVTVDGVRLHYLEKGRGQPIVLIHGNGVSAEDFAVSGLFDALARSHRVIAIDRPGFGYSERPRTRIWTPGRQAALIAKALAALEVRRPVVVGHSLGSLVALNLGLDYPAAVSGLVLMSGYYRPTPRLDSALASVAAIPVLGDLLHWTLSPLHARLMAPLAARRLFAPDKPTADFRHRFPLGLAARPSQIRAASADAMLMVPSAAAVSGRVADLKVPVLVMGGTGDQIADFDTHSRSLAGRLDKGSLKAFDDLGHMIHHLAPQETADAIEAFADLYQTADPALAPSMADGAQAEPINAAGPPANGNVGISH